MVDSNLTGIVFVNLAGEITEAKDTFLQILGYQREDSSCFDAGANCLSITMPLVGSWKVKSAF